MFFKIRVRSSLLRLFAENGLGGNPSALHPLADFLYYEYLNSWIDSLKKEVKDPELACEQLISFATQGRPVGSDQVDEELAKKIELLDDNGKLLQRLMGACALRRL